VFNKVGNEAKSFTESLGSLGTGLKKVAAAAVIVTTAIKAIKFADEVSQMASSIESLTWSYERLSRQLGINADENLQNLKDLSDGTVGAQDLILSANRAMILGVAKNTEEFNQLMAIARLRAKEMGLSTTQAFNDIVTGIGRASPMILDNLGFTVKMEAAQKNYASALGKTTDKLTENEKKEALKYAVLKEGMDAVQKAGDINLTYADKTAQMTTELDDLKVVIGTLTSPTLELFVEKITGMTKEINGAAGQLKDLQAKGEAIRSVFEGLGAVFEFVGRSSIEWILGPLNLLPDKIKEKLGISTTSSVEELMSDFDNIKSDLADRLKDVYKSIADETGGMASNVGDGIDSALDSEEAEKLAEKLGESFRDLAKTVVNSIDDQREAIRKLRDDMADLNDEYSTDVEDINRKYDKMVKDIEKTKGLGYRTEIADLEEERAYELSKKQKEYDKKALALSSEESQRTSYLDMLKSNVSSKSFLNTATSEGISFLGSIGQATTQQQIVFNFNGDVSDIETLKKTIVDMLNREAQLRGVAGK
jgi:hypothetical protein